MSPTVALRSIKNGGCPTSASGYNAATAASAAKETRRGAVDETV